MKKALQNSSENLIPSDDQEVYIDTKTMIEKGFKKAPMFETDNKVMTFPETLKWIKEQ